MSSKAKKDFPLVVISGPTAVGKGTVVKSLLKNYPQVSVATSATTREARPGEKHGEHYFFLSVDEFNNKIENNEFLEWATVHRKHKYGTLLSEIKAINAAGKCPILEIDVAGLRQVKKRVPGLMSIFIEPPTWEDLTIRIKGRGTESAEEIKTRLETASEEMEAAVEFDYKVVNDNVDDAVEKIANIIGLQNK
ncbi:MAG: guanylate kinase [Micrococcaceae bacterium]